MLLAIEATDRGGGVALVRDNEIIELVCETSTRTHSERLMSQIDSMLKKRDIEYQQIDCIAVSTGPGSFTAIRLGVTTAKTLAYCCDASLVGVSNLRLLAEYGAGPVRRLESAICARRGELYRQSFKQQSGKITPLSEPHLIKPEDLRQELNDGPEVLLLYRGRNWRPDLKQWSENVVFYPAFMSDILVSSLIEVASRRFERGATDRVDHISPCYIRRSDAQRSKEKENANK